MKLLFKIIVSFAMVIHAGISIYAAGAGSRAAYTRGGWVGAKYVAAGMTGEVTADDVYAIYWNPAGLTELKGKKKLSVDDIKNKARSGKVDEISESDLIKFSDEEVDKSFFQIGFSAAKLDIERNAGFAGCAFNLFKGVCGIGLYSIISTDIDRRNESGTYIDKLNYTGSSAYLSYGWSIGIISVGISIKGLYEKIGNVRYTGAGADIGTQVFVLPFLKVGFVIQDIGTGLYPIDSQLGVKKKYDFGYPTLRLGLSIVSDTGFSMSVSGIKKLDQDVFNYGLGIQYDFTDYTSVYLGLNDKNFSTGITVHLLKLDISYAFSIDRINNGYNNIVSLSLLF